jgi:hypothetical protein
VDNWNLKRPKTRKRTHDSAFLVPISWPVIRASKMPKVLQGWTHTQKKCTLRRLITYEPMTWGTVRDAKEVILDKATRQDLYFVFYVVPLSCAYKFFFFFLTDEQVVWLQDLCCPVAHTTRVTRWVSEKNRPKCGPTHFVKNNAYIIVTVEKSGFKIVGHFSNFQKQYPK